MANSYTTPSNYGFTDTIWHSEDVSNNAYAMSTRDVFGGPATIYDIHIDNDSDTRIYVKLYNKRLAIKDGTVSDLKAPVMIFMVESNKRYSIPFPSGYAFSNAVTVRAVQEPGTDGSTGPTGVGKVSVMIVGR